MSAEPISIARLPFTNCYVWRCWKCAYEDGGYGDYAMAETDAERHECP